MVKEHTLFMMEVSMRVDGRIVKNMVKEHILMEKGSGKETSI